MYLIWSGETEDVSVPEQINLGDSPSLKTKDQVFLF